MSIGTMSKNRTCISYGSNALTGSLEYLQGLILEDARSGTVQCPHNQCCFGIWNLTEGQLQVLVQAVLKRWKIPAAQLSSEATLELTKVTSGPEQKGRRELPKQELPDLQFLQILHHGQFSKLWQGTFKQQPVAIKAFPPLCHWQFESEWAVHSLPLMNHDNVIQLVAARCGGPSMEQGGLLVLTLYPLGSLRNFLSQHVCSWDITLRLGSSLARGLAFLHEEQWKEGLHKPGVAHRDLSSQNVLVREDWTSVISDFGLAVTLPESLKQWREDPAEHIVRTAEPPHYVAPEILDENLNLKDLGMALRQADVYSLALVLWEMFMRCSALFPEGATPEFQRAYEAELGSNPTHSDLWSLAVEERQRPAIPTAWKSFGQVWQARGAALALPAIPLMSPLLTLQGRGEETHSHHGARHRGCCWVAGAPRGLLGP
ncbi:anti-Muellerian hormone type-2 receptor isoform X5 [Pogona vitticeps]